MSLRLWLVRHGQSTWNAEGRIQGCADPPLTELGRWQAERVAQRLLSEDLTALYCSPLERAEETAAVIGDAVHLVPQVDERLREYDVGKGAEGVNWRTLVERWPHLEALAREGKRVSRHLPGAEPPETFTRRVLGAFDDIRSAYEEGEVGVVAHGGVFSEYLAYLLHAEPEYHPGLRFSNASLTLIELGGPGWVDIVFVNETCHLDGK